MSISEMKKLQAKSMEADRLAEILLSTNTNQIHSVLGELTTDDLHDLTTTILPNGHTLLHLLTQREKLSALRALLQRGVGAQARDAHGDTPLHFALQHNCLRSAKLLIEEGGANVSEVISRRKQTTLLHLMVACDRPHAVKLLLDNRVEVNARDREGRTPFHLAAVYGYSVVAAILQRYEQCDVNAVDEMGHTALMMAILNDNQNLARQLVDVPRVDVLLRDHKDRSSLHMAVSLGQLEVVRTLLRRNSANLHSKERSMGRAPIHLACALICSQSGIVSSNCLFDPDSWSRSGASRDGGADLNRNVSAHNGDQNTINHDSLLAWFEKLEALDLDDLVDSFSDVFFSRSSSVQSQIFPPFVPEKVDRKRQEHVVSGHGGRKASRTPRFVEERSNVTSARRPDLVNGNVVESASKRSAANTPRVGTPRKQQTPRQHDIKKHSHGLKSPSFSQKTKARPTDLSSSSKLRTRHSISGEPMLRTPRPQQSAPGVSLPKQVTTQGKRSSFRRPATAPAGNQDRGTSSVSFADPDQGRSVPLSYREPVQTGNSTDMTVTSFNIGVIRCRMVSLLLDYGADVNLMTFFRKSPLHIAAIIGAADVMAVLLPHITNINVLSASNKTALHLAVERNHVAVTAQLIHAGANLGLRDISGMTALHIAARFGYADIVRLLLKAKAEKNSTDFKQMSPLHHACLHNHPQVIDMLISAGSRLDVVDVAGFTPLDYRKTAQTGDNSDPPSTGSVNELKYPDSVLLHDILNPERPEKRQVSVSCGDKDKTVPQPALDFQRPGLLFMRNTPQKAS